MTSFDRKVNGLAKTHGALNRVQLFAIGGSQSGLERRVRSARLERPHPGVYVPAGHRWTWAERLQHACVAAGGHSYASHRAGSVMYGLDGVRAVPLEISVPYDDNPVPHGVLVHRSRRIEVVRWIDGVPVSTPERTLLELGAVVPLAIVEKALASALRTRLTTLPKLDAYLAVHAGRGRNGVGKLRRAIERYADGSPPPGSEGEVAFLQLIDDLGVEPPVRQYRIDLCDGTVAVVDFAWPVRRKVAEFDGLASRADTRAHDAELERQNAIWDAGWELRRFSPLAIRERPREVRAKLARFLL